jgi:hypothetical protein
MNKMMKSKEAKNESAGQMKSKITDLTLGRHPSAESGV